MTRVLEDVDIDTLPSALNRGPVPDKSEPGDMVWSPHDDFHTRQFPSAESCTTAATKLRHRAFLFHTCPPVQRSSFSVRLLASQTASANVVVQTLTIRSSTLTWVYSNLLAEEQPWSQSAYTDYSTKNRPKKPWTSYSLTSHIDNGQPTQPVP